MPDRVVITGATGFIGRQTVAPLVDLGYEVHLLVRHTSLDVLSRSVAAACRVHVVDLLDSIEVERCLREVRPTHLLHLAWHSDPKTRWSSPANLDWTAATLHLTRAFAEHGGQRVVVSGTCAEYDWSFDTLVEDETPLAPGTIYGASKAGVNRLLSIASSELALSVAWAHVFFCYGPGEPEGRLMHDVITGLLSGHSVACTEGTQVRDYLHTEDIGRAFSVLVDSDFSGSVNVASGIGVRVRDLVTTAADLLERHDLIRFGDKRPPAAEPPRLVADITRLRDTLRFRPRYDLESGLRQTIDWYRKRQKTTP